MAVVQPTVPSSTLAGVPPQLAPSGISHVSLFEPVASLISTSSHPDVVDLTLRGLIVLVRSTGDVMQCWKGVFRCLRCCVADPGRSVSDAHSLALKAVVSGTAEGGESVLSNRFGSVVTTPSRETVGFECLQLVVDEFAPTFRFVVLNSNHMTSVVAAYAPFLLTPSRFCSRLSRTFELFDSLVSLVALFCSQSADMNTSLAAVSMLWALADLVRQHPHLEPESQPTAAAPAGAPAVLLMGRRIGAPSETVPPIPPFPASATSGRDALWLSILSELRHLSMDARPEVRNCAVRTLFGVASTRGAVLSPPTSALCFYELLTRLPPDIDGASSVATQADDVDGLSEKPLVISHRYLSSIRYLSSMTSRLPRRSFLHSLPSNVAAAPLLGQLVHHSRDSAAKQWSETRVLAVQGISRCSRVFLTPLRISALSDASARANFIEAWSRLLGAFRSAIFGSSEYGVQASSDGSHPAALHVTRELATAGVQSLVCDLLAHVGGADDPREGVAFPSLPPAVDGLDAPESFTSFYSSGMMVVDGALVNVGCGGVRPSETLPAEVASPEPWGLGVGDASISRLALWNDAWGLLAQISDAAAAGTFSAIDAEVLLVVVRSLRRCYELCRVRGCVFSSEDHVVRLVDLVFSLLSSAEKLRSPSLGVAQRDGIIQSRVVASSQPGRPLTAVERAVIALLPALLPLPRSAWVQLLAKIRSVTLDRGASIVFQARMVCMYTQLYADCAPPAVRALCFEQSVLFLSALCSSADVRGSSLTSGDGGSAAAAESISAGWAARVPLSPPVDIVSLLGLVLRAGLPDVLARVPAVPSLSVSVASMCDGEAMLRVIGALRPVVLLRSSMTRGPGAPSSASGIERIEAPVDLLGVLLEVIIPAAGPGGHNPPALDGTRLALLNLVEEGASHYEPGEILNRHVLEHLFNAASNESLAMEPGAAAATTACGVFLRVCGRVLNRYAQGGDPAHAECVLALLLRLHSSVAPPPCSPARVLSVPLPASSSAPSVTTAPRGVDAALAASAAGHCTLLAPLVHVLCRAVAAPGVASESATRVRSLLSQVLLAATSPTSSSSPSGLFVGEEF